MNGYIKKLKDPSGNYIYPIVVEDSVYMSDETTKLSTKLDDINTQLAENQNQLKDIAIYLDDYFQVGDTNYSPALQRAIDYLQTDSKGGKIIAGKGVYNFKSTVRISKNGITIEGQTPSSTIFTIDSDFVGERLIWAKNLVNGSSVGKFSLRNIKFDSTNNTAGVHGIEFSYLIYNNEFTNLDFESFTGSWFKTERSGYISEHILWSNIQGNARHVTPTCSPWDLYHINESTMINCKTFGKQYHEYPYPTVPMLYCDRPQGFSILSSQFTSCTANAIKIEATSGNIQGVFIEGCTFENIRASTGSVVNVIYLSGFDSNTTGQYGKIGSNRYLEIVDTTEPTGTSLPPAIYVNNYYGLIVEDFRCSVTLDTGTQQCFVSGMKTSSTTFTNNGTNNLVLLADSSYQKVYGKTTGRYLSFSGDYSLIDFGIDSTNKIRMSADYQNSNLQRMRFLYNGTTDLGGVTNHGLYGKVKTDAGAPTTTYAPEGTIIPNSADNKLYVYIGGAWKSTTLT